MGWTGVFQDGYGTCDVRGLGFWKLRYKVVFGGEGEDVRLWEMWLVVWLPSWAGFPVPLRSWGAGGEVHYGKSTNTRVLWYKYTRGKWGRVIVCK